MIVVLPAAAVLLGVACLVWARRRYLVTTVDGTSMEPALRPGDRVLVRRTTRAGVGQVVVLTYPRLPGTRTPTAGRGFLIKRAVAVPGDRVPARWEYPDLGGLAGTVVPAGHLVVLGDNRATSWDSRHYGLVRRDQLIGVLVRHLRRPGDARPPRPSATNGTSSTPTISTHQCAARPC